MLISIAVMRDFDIVLYDIKTFFLYGKLEDEVFMEQPAGWEPEDKPRADWIWQLRRSMYGLPQASHCAQKKLHDTLEADGVFKRTTADDCVYVSQQGDPGKGNGYAALGAHVDDLLGIGDEKGLLKVEETMQKEFEITKERNPSVITGVQVERNREVKWLKLHQEAYIISILTDHDMLDCKSTDTPMDPGTMRAMMLLPMDQVDPVAQTKYSQLIGCLIWLHKTRADMMFTINFLSRFVAYATMQHYELARGRPLRYLKGSASYGIVFQAGSPGEWKLSGASDADLAGDINTSRSTSGYYTKLGKYGTVMASSKLERKISTSTGQAETYAMVSLVKELVWGRHLLQELLHAQEEPSVALTDNDGVLKQSTKAINHTTAKHYRIAQAYIRNHNGTSVAVGGVDTSKNPSDIFTKALHAAPFLRHRAALMGPQVPGQSATK
jgi:hypothetical protein